MSKRRSTSGVPNPLIKSEQWLDFVASQVLLPNPSLQHWSSRTIAKINTMGPGSASWRFAKAKDVISDFPPVFERELAAHPEYRN